LSIKVSPVEVTETGLGIKLVFARSVGVLGVHDKRPSVIDMASNKMVLILMMFLII
jgi:hypothetical protein